MKPPLFAQFDVGRLLDTVFAAEGVATSVIFVLVIVVFFVVLYVMYWNNNNSTRLAQADNVLQDKIFELMRSQMEVNAENTNALKDLSKTLDLLRIQISENAGMTQRSYNAFVASISAVEASMSEKHDETREHIIRPIQDMVSDMAGLRDAVDTRAGVIDAHLHAIREQIDALETRRAEDVTKLNDQIAQAGERLEGKIGDAQAELKALYSEVMNSANTSQREHAALIESLQKIEGRLIEQLDQVESVAETKPVQNSDLVANQPKDKKPKDDKEE